MSLLDDLVAELRATIDDLPLPILRRAMTEAHRAYDGLAAASRLGDPGSGDAGLRRLGVATTHLESGTGLIMRVQDEVGAYLTEIGGGRRPAPVITQRAETSELWWARRIARLTTETGTGCDDPARTPGELMARIARAVADGDRAGLHRQLVGAGAGLGSSLATMATRALDRLLADAPRHPADVADLLPGLPGRVATALIAGAGDVAADPTDLAVGAAVIAARLAHRLGRDVTEAAHA